MDAPRAARTGSALRAPHAPQEPDLRRDDRPVARDWYRRHDVALHADRYGDVEAAPGRQPGAAARAGAAGTDRGIEWIHLPAVPDRPRSRPRPRTCRLRPRAAERQHRRPGPANSGRPARLRQLLPAARSAARARPVVRTRRRSRRAGAPGRGAESRLLDAPLRRRGLSHRPDARGERHAADDRRRRAGGVLRRRSRQLPGDVPPDDDAAGRDAPDGQPASASQRDFDCAPDSRPPRGKRVTRAGDRPARCAGARS